MLLEHIRSVLLTAAAAVVAAMPLHAAMAETWPSKPIRLIVPFPPGGSTDLTARQYANQLSLRLGQPIVVENLGGANGTIGLSQLAKAKPDGYTLAVASNGNTIINQFLYSKLPFDPMTDFVPIALLAEFTNILVVKSDSPLKSLTDLIAYGKANPGSVTYGSAGPGASNHLGGYILMRQVGIEATHVPYKGSGPALIDVMAGNLTFMFDNVSTSLPHVQAGKLRVLATAGKTRMKEFPDAPAVLEVVPGYESVGWHSLFGPKGLPDEVVERLSREVADMIRDKAFADRLALIGMDVKSSTPDSLRARMVKEADALRPIMKESGIKID